MMETPIGGKPAKTPVVVAVNNWLLLATRNRAFAASHVAERISPCEAPLIGILATALVVRLMDSMICDERPDQ